MEEKTEAMLGRWVQKAGCALSRSLCARYCTEDATNVLSHFPPHNYLSFLHLNFSFIFYFFPFLNFIVFFILILVQVT